METHPRYTVADMPFGWRHVWIVSVASLGQLIGTALATVVGIIIPMLQILSHPELPSWLQGLLGAADLIGIAVGAVILGKLSDRWGYLLFFRICARTSSPTVLNFSSRGESCSISSSLSLL